MIAQRPEDFSRAVRFAEILETEAEIESLADRWLAAKDRGDEASAASLLAAAGKAEDLLDLLVEGFAELEAAGLLTD